MEVAAPRLVLDLRPHAAQGRTTTYTLTIYVDDFAVWPVRGEGDVGLEIQIDDLLAHLTEFWKPLMLRQVYPIDASPLRPSDLRREAERRWAELPAATVDAEEDAVSRFEEAHDLARAFAGIYGVPPFWILRSGEQFIVETGGALWRLPFAEVRRALTASGDWICERLAQLDWERWDATVAAWRERDVGDEAGLLAWSTGLNRALATMLIQEGALDAPRDFEDAANDNDELRIAARMAGALPPDQIREIIALARQFGHYDACRLHELSKACLEHITGGFDRAAPFQQGEAAARFAREQLGVPADRPVQVFEITAWLGIDVRHAPAEPPTLDGLAICGSRFGPGVFLNESSGRILSRGNTDVTASQGARVTLAHELCHLLLDGVHAHSAIEVLKARMPAGVEQRAKSFAGEFLLPTHIAGRHWQDCGRPANRTGLNALVEELVKTYLVTRSVAAWKVEHAARDYSVDLGVVLDAVAPRR
jgi:hypothetical protein